MANAIFRRGGKFLMKAGSRAKSALTKCYRQGLQRKNAPPDLFDEGPILPAAAPHPGSPFRLA
jgi:hypothetical protein